MQPTVLFVASTAAHILNFHLPYLRRFQEMNWNVHVACGGPEMEIPFVNRTIYLPFEEKITASQNFRAVSLLRELMQAEDYAFVSVHTPIAAFLTRVALLRLKKHVRLVNVVHGYPFDDETPFLKYKLLLAAEQLTASKTDLLITMNSWDHETAKQWQLGKRVTRIPGIGVDLSKIKKASDKHRQELRREYVIAPGAFVLLYAAKFSKRKNQEMLIRAMKKLPDDVYLVLAGDGALHTHCMELAEKLGVSKRVIFPGHVDMNPWYDAADAAVSSSRSEGLPFNIVEAMYAGLPVIASAVKGHVDLIHDGKNGVLYPCDDEDEFINQVLRLMENALLRKQLREQAEQDAAQYSLNRVLLWVMDEYESLMPTSVTAGVRR